MTVSGGCESLLLTLHPNQLFYTKMGSAVYQFCKTNGCTNDTLVNTILMYLLSIGVISQFTHDGEKSELVDDVDAALYKGLSGYDYTTALWAISSSQTTPTQGMMNSNSCSHLLLRVS